MKKGRNGSYLLLKTNENPAVTQFFSYSLAPNLRLFLLKPHTGKTHQLRVAMKSLGAPILGDSRYYPSNQQDDQQKIGHLHAWQLAFDLNEQKFSFEAQPRWTQGLVKEWLITNREMNDIKWPELN
jgi:tRNA pseudouridine32 synthase/23S rRNA pseudouridine746 synthase